MFRDSAGHEDLTEALIGGAIRVHEFWGPGLLESVSLMNFNVPLVKQGIHRMVRPDLPVRTE